MIIPTSLHALDETEILSANSAGCSGGAAVEARSGTTLLLAAIIPLCHPAFAQGPSPPNQVQRIRRQYLGQVRTPLLVGARGRKILVEQVGRDRESVQAVGGLLEAAGLARLEPVLAHQPRGAPP